MHVYINIVNTNSPMIVNLTVFIYRSAYNVNDNIELPVLKRHLPVFIGQVVLYHCKIPKLFKGMD